MTPPARPARRPAALAALLCAVAGVVAPSGDALAQAENERLTVQVAVEEISPYLSPEGSLVLRARLVSRSSIALDRVQVRIRVDDAVRSRSELQQLAGSPPDDADFLTVDDELVPDELSPGDVAEIDLRIPAESPELRRLFGSGNGVHPLRIEVRARGAGSTRTRVGVADTFLPWWTADTDRTRIAWLWPLVSDDHRGADGRFVDDDLAEEISDDGRLDTLLTLGTAAAPTTPVTWVIDPLLAESVAAMSRGYDVPRKGGSTEGAGQPAATAWLTAARAALADGRTRTVALPYADPDIAALTRAGLRDVVGNAIRTGRSVLNDVGLPQGDLRVSWPPDGAVDVPTLGVLASNGIRDVIVADTGLESADDNTNATPSAASSLDGATATPLTAIAADSALSALVAEGPAAGGTAEGTRLALQRVLAETAFFTLERPSVSRDLVIAPPRLWNPSRPFAAGLLALSGEVPWLRPDVISNVAQRPRDDVERFLSYTGVARERELPAGLLESSTVEREQVERYRSILVPGSGDTATGSLPDRLELALLRSTSARFRDDLDGAGDLLSDVRDVLSSHFEKVSVAQGGVITMGGDTARLPITIVNDLDATVRVQVRIDSRNRLSLPDGEVRTEVVPPGRRQLQVSAQAQVPGDFIITVALATPDGRALPGEPTTLRVRSSAYGKVALAVTIGAFVLLLLGSAARLIRRRRTASTEPQP
ncbi:MAG TPA: DUF6049 family protein [Mycobacteriales bacterium]|nr:DUF6049 family protein [Mycobacteriales bacterium]